jgi:RNA polymerase sigma-70 factor (ECF subfamily)
MKDATPTAASTAWPPSGAANGAHDALVEEIARCGDTRAFENLFRHYAPRLKGVGIRSGMSADVAEELAQETMISVWRRAPTFERSRGGASRWIFAIFRNKRIDYLRRNPPCETALDEVLCLRSDDDDPETSADLRSIGRILQRALQALPPNQAEVLLEVYYAGRSHTEAASRLNLPVGTVKSRIRLALARIRLSLEATGEADQCFCASPGGGSDRDTAGASSATSLGSCL